MRTTILFSLLSAILLPINAMAEGSSTQVSDQFIEKQRVMLKQNTDGKGFGPQSPRDIDSVAGRNQSTFTLAPPYQQMNLCNIHFHKNAEHKGGEFTRFAGNGDGKGYSTGYRYSGQLSKSERSSVNTDICPGKHGSLKPGDTIEVHYVHTTAQVNPGPTLGACLSEATKNPQLRVETQVYVLVNDDRASDFVELTRHEKVNGVHQATHIPDQTGAPIQYIGSTTGPGFNEQGSPFQVTWNVRPKVEKVNITTVGTWCEGNAFNEDHAHGVRNLVINPDLLSDIKH